LLNCLRHPPPPSIEQMQSRLPSRQYLIADARFVALLYYSKREETLSLPLITVG
jgi:hypothetical protein